MGFVNKINNGTELYCGLVMFTKFIDNGCSRGYATYNIECFAFESKDEYYKKSAECFRDKKEFVNITDSKLFYELTNCYPNLYGKFVWHLNKSETYKRWSNDISYDSRFEATKECIKKLNELYNENVV